MNFRGLKMTQSIFVTFNITANVSEYMADQAIDQLEQKIDEADEQD